MLLLDGTGGFFPAVEGRVAEREPLLEKTPLGYRVNLGEEMIQILTPCRNLRGAA